MVSKQFRYLKNFVKMEQSNGEQKGSAIRKFEMQVVKEI